MIYDIYIYICMIHLMIYDDLWWFMMIYDDLWWFMMIYDFQVVTEKKNMVIYAGLASINHPSPGPLADLRCQPWGSTAAASRCCWIAWCSDGLPTPTALGWAMASRPSLGRWLGVERFKHLYRTHHYIDYTYVYIYMNIYIYIYGYRFWYRYRSYRWLKTQVI